MEHIVAKPLKTVGKVLGIAAVVAAVVFPPAAAILAVASTAATLGSQALQKPPPARGSVSQSIIQSTAPQPYVMGEGYVGGVLRHDTGFGGTVDDVDNPYRFQAWVYSGGGPIESISPRVDFATAGSYYTGFLTTDTQLGATPESDPLTSSFGSPPGWGSTYKLSGQAAIGWSFKFDKKGKKFASGLPVVGAYGQWVKVYDPRLDSTFPGGSGSHRLGTESTYEYSANPALHAGTYAYGRYQNGKRVFGIGLPEEGIDWATVAAWANVCDTNGWTIFGRIFEPGDRGQNLTDICAAGGAQPIFAGAVLSFHYSAPVVALDTLTDADIADEACNVTAQQSYRNRLNTIIPKYTSSAHNWEQVSAEPVVVSSYVTQDGEERAEEWPFNLVKDVDQAAQLATYRLVDGREFHPITLVCHPRMRGYRPGDCLHLELKFGEDALVLDTDAIILTREIDPATMKVTFTLIGETAAKHAFALGETGTAPETPVLGQTGEEADQTVGSNASTFSTAQAAIRAATIRNPRNTGDSPLPLLNSTELTSSVTITVARHDWDYPDGTIVTRELDAAVTTLDDGTTPIPENDVVFIYFDDATRLDDEPEYKATLDPEVAVNSETNPDRHPLGYVQTAEFGTGGTFNAEQSIGYGFR